MIFIQFTCIRNLKFLSKSDNDFILKLWNELIDTRFGSLKIDKYLAVWINLSKIHSKCLFITFFSKVRTVDSIDTYFIENTWIFFDGSYQSWSVSCDNRVLRNFFLLVFFEKGRRFTETGSSFFVEESLFRHGEKVRMPPV